MPDYGLSVSKTGDEPGQEARGRVLLWASFLLFQKCSVKHLIGIKQDEKEVDCGDYVRGLLFQ